METVNSLLYKRLVEKWLKPYRKKWKLRSYSLVIERIFAEWQWFYQTYPELFDKLKVAAKEIDTNITPK